MWTTLPFRIASVLLLFQTTLCQTISPSNSTDDLYDFNNAPRFIMNGSQLAESGAINMAPLGPYGDMTHATFLGVRVEGKLVNVGAWNVNSLGYNSYAYVSCDAEDYSGVLGPSAVFQMVMASPRTGIVILYSRHSDHCVASGLYAMPTVGGVLTTTNSDQAARLFALNLGLGSSGTAVITPDLASYTNTSSWGGMSSKNGTPGQPPTTAIAMVLLYAITGIITASFVAVIITGAIRAHRHPERYRRSNVLGRGRPSRAKGLAQAMLDTIPVIKFGDRRTGEQKDGDVEMANTTHATAREIETVPKPAEQAAAAKDTPNTTTTSIPTSTESQETEEPGEFCSICTDEFSQGQEVRVLPCNHMYHPECVDPWLLNVSGTCPLCRINLDPTKDGGEGTTSAAVVSGSTTTDEILSPINESSSRRAHFRQIALMSREERIAFLRRWRQDRRNSVAVAGTTTDETETERRGRTRRFGESFRIRTERRGVETVPERDEPVPSATATAAAAAAYSAATSPTTPTTPTTARVGSSSPAPLSSITPPPTESVTTNREPTQGQR